MLGNSLVVRMPPCYEVNVSCNIADQCFVKTKMDDTSHQAEGNNDVRVTEDDFITGDDEDKLHGGDKNDRRSE